MKGDGEEGKKDEGEEKPGRRKAGKNERREEEKKGRREEGTKRFGNPSAAARLVNSGPQHIIVSAVVTSVPSMPAQPHTTKCGLCARVVKLGGSEGLANSHSMPLYRAEVTRCGRSPPCVLTVSPTSCMRSSQVAASTASPLAAHARTTAVYVLSSGLEAKGRGQGQGQGRATRQAKGSNYGTGNTARCRLNGSCFCLVREPVAGLRLGGSGGSGGGGSGGSGGSGGATDLRPASIILPSQLDASRSSPFCVHALMTPWYVTYKVHTHAAPKRE